MPSRKKHPPASPPQIPNVPDLTQYQKESIKELQAELRDRKVEALKLYRPNPIQEQVHACKASEILVIGGNRSGKSLCTFVEDARAVTGQDPYNKYPKKDGNLIIIGKDWKHVGLVCYPLLFRPGAFKIIKDEDTGEWRAFDPVKDKERSADAKPAPPLIPPRFIKSNSWVLKSAQYIQQCNLTTGWTIYFFSSEGDPQQGYQANRIHVDEDINRTDHIPEAQARLADRKGVFTWSAMPHSTNDALLNLKERADEAELLHGQDSPIRQFKLRFLDNPYIDQEEKQKNLDRWAAAGEDVVRMRAEGDFVTDSILVYPTFDMSIHGMSREELPENDIPSDWCRYAVVDPGHTVTGVLFAAVPPTDDFVLLYDELYLKQCNAKIFGEHFARKTLGRHFHAFIVDAHGGRLRDIGSGRLPVEQYTEQLINYGVKSQITGSSFLAGCDDIMARTEATRVAMHIRPEGTPQLRVLRAACPNFEHEMKRYRKKTNNVAGMSIVTDQPNTRGAVHLCQCLEYLCAYRPKYHKPPPKNPESEPWWVKWQKDRKKRMSESGGTYVYLGPQGGRNDFTN